MLPSRGPVWSRRSRHLLLAAAAALALAATATTATTAALHFAAAATTATTAPIATAAIALTPAAIATSLAAAALALAICLHINRPDVGGWARRVPVSRRRSRKHPQRRGERRCVGRRPSSLSSHQCVDRCD